MADQPKFILAASVALSLGLSGCGGGGGGGGLASTPTPTPTPGTSIGAPGLAVVGGGGAFPTAVDGGATLQSQVTTTFPLLQSTLSISPSGVVADTATMNSGSTLTFASGNNSYTIDIQNKPLGVSNLALSPNGHGDFQAYPSGAANVFLQIANPATSNLSWTSYGMWDVVTASGARTQSAFVTGYETPVAGAPTQGTATYSGSVFGEVIGPAAGRENGVNYGALSGDALLQANFGAATITGNLTNMFTTDFEGIKTPWNSISLLGTFSGPNVFTGTAATTSAPGGNLALSSSATGTFAGKLFGPRGEELGAVWTLSDGVRAAFGTIGAKAVTGEGSPWDY
ncbi:MAG: transferrin-binding protein-like solute binding protein [Sphingomicrobium sp.]